MQIWPGAARTVSRGPGTQLRHAFSAGPHYDPDNVALGPLVVHDEVRLAAGAGFAAHRHRGEDVVTVVLAGTLVHEDDAGHTALVRVGQVARLAAGSGVVHTERADSGPALFVQARLLADDAEPPAYAVRDVVPAAGLVTAIDLGRAALLVGRLRAAAVVLPAAAYLHVHVVAGSVELDGAGVLAGGDAARLGDAGPRQVRGTGELLVWVLRG